MMVTASTGPALQPLQRVVEVCLAGSSAPDRRHYSDSPTRVALRCAASAHDCRVLHRPDASLLHRFHPPVRHSIPIAQKRSAV